MPSIDFIHASIEYLVFLLHWSNDFNRRTARAPCTTLPPCLDHGNTTLAIPTDYKSICTSKRYHPKVLMSKTCTSEIQRYRQYNYTLWAPFNPHSSVFVASLQSQDLGFKNRYLGGDVQDLSKFATRSRWNFFQNQQYRSNVPTRAPGRCCRAWLSRSYPNLISNLKGYNSRDLFNCLARFTSNRTIPVSMPQAVIGFIQ